MTRACFNVLKPDGRIAVTNIYVAGRVSECDYRRILRARGPGAAETRALSELMERAGFVAVRERDVTRAFAQTTRRYLEASERYRLALSAELGPDPFAEAQRNRRETLALIEEGILRRSIFTGRRPGG